MIGSKTHKDLKVCNHAMELAEEVYALTRSFPKEELYGLTSQIRRAAVSISCNIAEGAARRSRKEFLRSLAIAFGSVAELETQLLLAVRIRFLGSNPTSARIEEIRRMLIGLIRSLSRTPLTDH